MNGPVDTVYGIIAFEPNLSRSGSVLILEGQTVASTEAAADFVFGDAYLMPFLTRIRQKNGTTPHFDLLLRTKSLGRNTSRLEVLAYRVEE